MKSPVGAGINEVARRGGRSRCGRTAWQPELPADYPPEQSLMAGQERPAQTRGHTPHTDGLPQDHIRETVSILFTSGPSLSDRKAVSKTPSRDFRPADLAQGRWSANLKLASCNPSQRK